MSSSSFKPNPLSLSVPDPALDRWLRDSGYLDLLDSSAAATTPTNPTSTSSGAAADVLAFARTLASLLTLNPFAGLSTADLAAPTPSWSLAFIGAPGAASYSWPSTPTQARLRVQENVRRYARNYAALSILIFACCLYTNVPDAYGVAGAVGQPRGVGGCAVLPGPVGARHTSTWDWAGSSAFCPNCHCYTAICVQHAVCSCICHWAELCSHDVACFSSKVDSLKPI